jgi:hypothetical protein
VQDSQGNAIRRLSQDLYYVPLYKQEYTANGQNNQEPADVEQTVILHVLPDVHGTIHRDPENGNKIKDKQIKY